MNKDLSFELYTEYFKFPHRVVEIQLRNGKNYQGIFISFSHGDFGEPYIYQWHLVEGNEFFSTGMDSFYFPNGVKILQKDIKVLTFKDSSQKFNF